MGRRARTNCSPVGSAMEKYHQDIGNRLSGVFSPPHPCPANSDDASACEAFSMLTLDFRGQKSTKNHQTVSPLVANTLILKDNCESTHEKCNNDSHKDDSAFDQTPKRSDTMSSLNSQIENMTIKEKRNLMDKLARAIFQRKHTCARCQRRSRSCLQNKTFNINEKHYTCARCRETSRAIKNLVSGQDPTINETSKNRTDIILPKPRLYLKDSGYETVTSCSTVASAHSNTKSPSSSLSKQHTNKSAGPASLATSIAPPCSRVVGSDEEGLNPKDNTINCDTPYSKCPVSGYEDVNALYPSNTPTQTPYANTNNEHPSGLEHFMGVTDDSGVRILKQVKARYVQNYDGYLPSHEPFQHPCDVLVQPDYASTNPHQHQQQQQHRESNEECDCDSNNTSHPHRQAAKACHICATTSRPCFRLPWEGGWLCEDCLDGML